MSGDEENWEIGKTHLAPRTPLSNDQWYSILALLADDDFGPPVLIPRLPRALDEDIASELDGLDSTGLPLDGIELLCVHLVHIFVVNDPAIEFGDAILRAEK
jgi:hypothetical protein